MSRHLSLLRVHISSSPFPPPGPCGSGSPVSSVLRLAPTPRHPSRVTSFPSVSGTTLRPLAMQVRRTRLACAEFWFRSAAGLFAWRCRGLPGSWGVRRVHALLCDPGEAGTIRSFRWPGVAFRRRDIVGPHDRLFRGSITRPTRWLSTLRSRGRPRATQDSLPVGDQPSPGGVEYPRDSIEGFRFRSFVLLLQACLAHLSCTFSGRIRAWVGGVQEGLEGRGLQRKASGGPQRSIRYTSGSGGQGPGTRPATLRGVDMACSCASRVLEAGLGHPWRFQALWRQSGSSGLPLKVQESRTYLGSSGWCNRLLKDELIRERYCADSRRILANLTTQIAEEPSHEMGSPG